MTEETTAPQAEIETPAPQAEVDVNQTEIETPPQDVKDEKPAEPSEEQKAERMRKREKTQRRINQLTREKKEAQAETQKLKDELAKHNQVKAPDPEQFETQEEYIDAQVNYRLSQNETPAPVVESGPDFDSIVQTGKEKYPDFEQVAMSDKNLTQGVAEIVAMTDNPDDIFYHLGGNPVELERISLLDTAQMAREIGKLEATVSIPKPKTTQTPEPVKPLESGESIPVDESKLSMSEWAKRRNATRWKQGKI